MVVAKRPKAKSKPAVKKETLKDLDPKRSSGGVKGGGGAGASKKTDTNKCCPTWECTYVPV